ncbi:MULTISPECIES: helix-turn-helix domain-containing protein [Phenylobacterium]|uniref:AraC-like DNA-binding protein/type IV secretory pathway VirB2 component (Pilin) n=1 Tax=Phenylobacterium koreense TaxID=266125 RepID=A0ABV2ED74_9CAUL
MSRASALSPPAGRMLRPWRPPSRVTAYGSLAVASFVCYIAAQLLDAPLAKRFAIIGLGACGWSWLLTRALFDPAKRDVRWARIVGLTVVVTGGLTALVPSGGELSRFSENIYALSGSAALLLTFVEPFHHYRPSLPAAEKRFRAAFLGVYTLLIMVSIIGLRASDSAASAHANSVIKSICALVGLVAATAAVWYRRRHPLQTEQRPTATRRAANADDARLAERLLRLLREEEIDRDPDLRVADVAARLGEPEHRVSQCVSLGLGFTNFNRLINHHRIERAKALLADGHERRSILEIAFECGFASIGPFNRAFKDEVGLTPRAFRAASRGEVASTG